MGTISDPGLKIRDISAYFPPLLFTINEAYNCVCPSGIMAPSTRQNKRSSEDSDFAGPQQKRTRYRKCKGGATPSPIIEFPNPAQKHRAEPDADSKPSLIVIIPCSAQEHCEEPDAGATPSLIVTGPFPAEENPTTSKSMQCLAAKAPRGRTPSNKQKVDQQSNNLPVDPRPQSWGMPEVWAKVFHKFNYNRYLILTTIA